MHHRYRYLFGFFVLTAALAAPTAIRAAAKPQDNGRQAERQDDKDQNRVYDRSHKDYHNWDANEDRSYRQYLGDKHKEYRPFTETKPKEQTAYWNWRHGHPDQDNGH